MTGDPRAERDRGDDWDDGRITAAFRALAAGASTTGLAEAVVAAIRTPVWTTGDVDRAGTDPQPIGPQPSLEEIDWVAIPRSGLTAVAQREPRPRRVWLALVAALIVAAAGIGYGIAGHLSSNGSGSLHHFKIEGIEFDYPASWTIHDQGWPSTGFGSTWAILGTHAWPASCAASDLNCYYEAKLEPGTIAVEVGLLAMPSTDLDLCTRGATGSDLQGRGPDDPVATQALTRVDGRPALRTTYAVGGKDYYGSDEWRNWSIAAAGTVDEAYSINAMYRGPGTDAMKADLDRLIASVRITPALGGSGNADCGPPFPPASGP